MLGKIWRYLRRNHPVWHRVRIVPGDDKKVPHLALLQQFMFGFKRGGLNFRRDWNWADNPRRQAMQDAVDFWFALEDAMHRVREHEKDNDVAIQYAHEHHWRAGVSEWKQAARIPREGLIPIPPEFKKVKEFWDRAHTDHRGRPTMQRLNPNAPPESIAVFYPEGSPTPDIRLDGQQVHTHPWNVERGRERERQGKRRQRGKGNNSGGQQPQNKGGRMFIGFEDGDD